MENPRDASGADPCSLLAAGQLGEFGLSGPAIATTVPEGPRCTWGSGRAPTVTLTLYTGGGGLATLAQNSQPTTTRVRLAGYPALETFTERGEFCQYDVAVAADQAVMVSLEGAAPDSCTALQAVVPAVLSNLPPLAG